MSVIDLGSIKRETADFTEGSASPRQQRHLAQLAGDRGVLRIAEIGFNEGVSARAFLAANPIAEVVSFDIGTHDYVHQAKDQTDFLHPGRHTLVVGDSTETVPEYDGAPFDLIFIDGGHENEIPHADIKNMARLAAEKATVVVDDITPWNPWGKAPAKALSWAWRNGLITPTGIHFDRPNARKVFDASTRVWATARYTKQAATKAAEL